MRMQRLRSGLFALCMLAVLGITAAKTSAAGDAGDYSSGQALAGASVYTAKCASCHAQNLSGVYGLALVGALFKKSIAAHYKTAAELYTFDREVGSLPFA